MSERRWSTRLKAKLLRRSSTSSKKNIVTTTTTTSTSASTPDFHPQPYPHPVQRVGPGRVKDAAEELPADPNFDCTTTTTTTQTTTPPLSTPSNVLPPSSHPPPPLSSASRPSISSFTESQYTPDELASAAGSPGGQYFFVPEYHRPASRSSAQRPDEQSVTQSVSPTKAIAKGLLPQPTEQHQLIPARRRFEPAHDRERARSGSSRKGFPAELFDFPLPPLRRDTDLSSITSPSPTTKPDRASLPANFTPRDRHASAPVESPATAPLHAVAEKSAINTYQSFPIPPSALSTRPSLISRRQSLLPASHQHLVSSLLNTGSFSEADGFANRHIPPVGSGMGLRKIWVRRPGGSATLLPTSEDALVDELRDQVVLKYANSLGKTFDAPDIIIRIATREGSTRLPTPERILSPEEPLWSVVDSFYPGGQTVAEALVIEIPSRRTPKPSPRHNVYFTHSEPGEHGDYFPLMPTNVNVPTPPTHQSTSANSSNTHPGPSISILTTGHAPPLPSPGGRPRGGRRPPLTRNTTHSPTLIGSTTSKDTGSAPSAAPAPTPPVPNSPVPPPESPQVKAHTPPARVASPRPGPGKTKKSSRASLLNGAFGGLIEGTVPPINVLIVEDNVINQKLLEAFMKRLSVRWKCAANGAEAVTKWREGGFHLVLMDIQLPVMNGLDATKEIRRLERLNGIGVFPKKSSGSTIAAQATASSPTTVTGEDKLPDLSLFKSPVIIVALTASSLQSDRHEALAAGCNDFLTKPVRFEWLEQKVTEWGCMQALIDFEGWRKWRGFMDDQSDSSKSASGSGSNSDGRSSPRTTNAAVAASPSPAAKKLEVRPGSHHLKRGILAEDSPDSGDGSDSPGSMLVDGPSPLHEGNI